MKKFIITALAMLLLTSCTSAEKKSTEPQNAAPAPAQAATEPQAEAPKAEAPKAEAPAVDSDAAKAKLLDPSKLNETAPDMFVVNAVTTKGTIKFELHRDWAPNGVDRFYNLVKAGFFSDIALFRMAQGFVVQFGIHGSPLVSSVWRDAKITDDPVKETNARGTLVFATSGPNTRTTQLFINLGDNAFLDGNGFSPIGKIVEGMDILEKLNFEYGESPNQGAIQMKGNEYLKKNFPNLDYFVSRSIAE